MQTRISDVIRSTDEKVRKYKHDARASEATHLLTPRARILTSADRPTHPSRAVILVFGCVCLAGAIVAAAQETGRTAPKPTFKDVAYGPHSRNVVDFYQASSDKPTPLLVYFHGGGFRNGSKDRVNVGLCRLCIENGVSFAAANYRLSQQEPYPAQMHDAARAIQFLRHQASDWNIDPDRVAAFGGSAGAGISLWLAFHDSLANPNSDDPIARQSTRLSCAIGLQAQCTYDPREIMKIVPGRAYDQSALKQLFGVPRDWDWKTDQISEELSRKMKDASPITHLTADDPPVFVYHREAQDVPGDIHHGNFGRHLKTQMDALGIPCARHMSSDFKDAQGHNQAIFEFLKMHFELNADVSRSESPEKPELKVNLRSRTETESSGITEVHRTASWAPTETAIIICDMWDDHTCKGAAQRVAEMAPALQRTISAARERGVMIIHAPSGTMSFYEGTQQRRRAIEAPYAKAPVKIQWNHWDPQREGQPHEFMLGGGCGCIQPCTGWIEDEKGKRHWKGGKPPWIRQIATIEISAHDAISDNGQEIFNLLQHRNVKHVVLMGVHTNICVSGRPFGLRQMVYLGKEVVLCRDLTDSFFQPTSPDFSHFLGTQLVVEHIEQRLCPTISSTCFTGLPEFQFANALSETGSTRRE